MKTFTAASLATLVAMTSFFQAVPAPPAAIGLLVTSGLTAVGTVIQEYGPSAPPRLATRQDDVSLPPEAQRICQEQLSTATVTVTQTARRSVLFAGLPPACMTLASSWTGTGTHPIPMGSDSVQYNDVSEEEIVDIIDALNAQQAM